MCALKIHVIIRWMQILCGGAIGGGALQHNNYTLIRFSYLEAKLHFSQVGLPFCHL